MHRDPVSPLGSRGDAGVTVTAGMSVSRAGHPAFGVSPCPQVGVRAAGSAGGREAAFAGGSPRFPATPVCPVNLRAELELVGLPHQPPPRGCFTPPAASQAGLYKCLKLRAGPKFPPRQQLLREVYTQSRGAMAGGPPLAGFSAGGNTCAAAGGCPWPRSCHPPALSPEKTLG